MVYKGIDVSRWQEEISWPKVKAAGIQFAMLRSSYGWGAKQKDRFFEDNYEMAKKVNIAVGVYHYAYATTVEEAVKEADFCYSVIKGKQLEYPVAYDLEENSIAALGKEKISQIAKAFCERMESYGYYVCIYANKFWLDNYFTDDIFNRYDIWLAQWAAKPTFERAYGIWQKSSKGRVDGIRGYVDLDESYKNYGAIMKYNGLNGFSKKEDQKPSENKKPAAKQLVAGTRVSLKKVKLYGSATAQTEAGVISGNYYIYDGKAVNGRYRITNSADRVGKKPVGEFVTGFVKKSDLV